MEHKNGYQASEKQLVDKILDGNTSAFTILIQNTERMVAQIVCKMTSNPHDQKDLVQEIYIKAYNHLNHFNYKSKLSTWIASIAYNACIDHLRRKKITLSLDEEHNQQEEEKDALLQQDRKNILQNAINKLSPVYRTLITLYHNEELSYEEIGEITQLPAGTIKNYLFRARRALKNNLLVKYRKEDI